MFPVLFTIPGTNFPVTSFGLMMFLCFLAGAWIGGKQLERYGLPADHIWDNLAWCAIAGIAGAKIYYLALHWDALMADFWGQIFSRGGLVWYGGLIGGVIAFGVQTRNKKLPLATMYDAAAPAIALAYAVGRLGCFLVGDDYGRYTGGPYGIAFPKGTPISTAGYLRSLGDNVPASIADAAVVTVHPTQLYEIALALIILGILWKLAERPLRTGQLFAAFLFLYSIERFLIEFVRAKNDRFVLGLSTSQLLSIFVFFAAIALWQARKDSPLAPRAADGSPVPRGTPRPARATR